jgi:membrane protein
MKFIKAIFSHFMRSNTFEKGAALSYYTVFSFLPVIMIITSVLGLLFKEDAISAELYNVLNNIVGDQGALQFEALIKNQHFYHNNILTTIIGIATLLLTATGMFNQIHKSLNAIWGLKVKPEKSVLNYLARHITSLLILIFIGFILLLSTTINSLFIKYSSRLPDVFINAHLYEYIISFFLITLLFAVLFRSFGNAIVPWKTAIVSAGFTSILFLFGKIGIGLYIANSAIKSTFGAASILALLMIWVFYSSQILYLGASFAYVFGKKTGAEIKPTKQAVRYVQKELR